MQSSVFVCLALVAVTFCSAEDDGRYHPGKYGGDDGSYRHVDGGGDDGRYYESRYGDYFGKNNKYNSIYSAFQPVNYKTYSPFQNLVAPLVDNSIDYSPLASSVSAVNYQSVTSRPFVQPRQPVYSRTQSTNDHYANIVRQDVDLDGNAYHYLYQTDNGIAAEETGRVDGPGTTGGTKANGFFEYVGDDGVKYRVDYIADENGFQPRGAHLPQ